MSQTGQSVSGTSSNGAKRAARAQAAWERGDPGFYVANIATTIVVAGPFYSLISAELRAAEHEPPSMGVAER